MKKADFPNFHKKNLLKREETEARQTELLEEFDRFLASADYPIKKLSISHKDESYIELDAAVQFYNQGMYSEALEVFKSRPADPARLFKNLICTFHGPIGWLLMFNTKVKKDAFIRFCIASCEYNLDNFSAALDAIKDDNNEESLYLKAWCQNRLDMHEESKANFKKVFNMNPRYMQFNFPYQKETV